MTATLLFDSYRRPPHGEDPHPRGHLQRPDGATNGRHGRHVTPTDGFRAWQLKGRECGGLHHVHAVRWWRFFATRAPRQCATLNLRRRHRAASWSQDHCTNRRCYYGCGSGRLEEAGRAAIAARRVSWKSQKTMSQQGCESVLHPSTWCTILARPSAAVMGQLRRGRRAFNSGCVGGARRAMRPVFCKRL